MEFGCRPGQSAPGTGGRSRARPPLPLQASLWHPLWLAGGSTPGRIHRHARIHRITGLAAKTGVCQALPRGEISLQASWVTPGVPVSDQPGPGLGDRLMMLFWFPPRKPPFKPWPPLAMPGQALASYAPCRSQWPRGSTICWTISRKLPGC